MSGWKSIADIRREYGELSLDEQSILADPLAQFSLWFEQVLSCEQSDPTAMLLSTVDEQGLPDARVVLLKGMEQGHFVFYTNYQSTKAMHLKHTPYAALTFYWPQMARQVRVRGRVSRLHPQLSDAYFASRPNKSQLSAIVSPQSQVIANRAVLEQKLNELIAQYGQEPVLRPEHWGGFELIPDEIEFWQGRDNRLHDRIHYVVQEGQWTHRRLAP